MERNLSRYFGSASHIHYFQAKNQMQFSVFSRHWGFGLCSYTMKEIRLQQLIQSPISCDTLELIMVWRLITLRGCFIPPPPSRPPPYILNYDLNGRLTTLPIHPNLFWLTMITSYQLIDKVTPDLMPSF